MVASDSGASSAGITGHGGSLGSSYRVDGPDTGNTLSKLRHTLTSGIHGTVNKLSPTRSSLSTAQDSGIASSTSSLSSTAAGGLSAGSSLSSSAGMSSEERSLLQKVWEKGERYDPPEARFVAKPPPISTPTAPVGGTFCPLSPPVNGAQASDTGLGPSKPVRAPGSNCRVCVKTISDSEYYRRCSECNQKVCEDCASYSSNKDTVQDTWHCSICRRRLLPRSKKETPGASKTATAGEIGIGLTIATEGGITAPPLVTPTAALSPLVSGIASMASSFASSLTPTTVSQHGHPQTSTLPHTKPSTSSGTAQTTSVSHPTSSTLTNVSYSSTAKIPSKDDATPNGVPRKDVRRASHVPQRSSSREDIKDRRASTIRRGKELSHREKPPVSRWRSDNEEDLPIPNKPAITAARRGHRVSDYMLRDPTDEQCQGRPMVKILHPENEGVAAFNNQRHPQEGPPKQLPLTAVQTLENVNAGMINQSPEAITPEAEGSARILVRRKSIVRQKPCDEDIEDNTLLTLWSTGQLPVRRHSAQDPSRKPENSEFQRSKESLDVPQGAVHRHHSWDFNFARSSGQGKDSLLPNTIPATTSRFSSDSDMSIESISERGGQSVGLDDANSSRRLSRVILPSNRNLSYRAPRGDNEEEAHHQQFNSEEYTSAADSSCMADLSAATTLNNRRPGTSSLEDDPWLHPAEDEWRSTRRRSSAVSDSGRVLPTPPASPRMSCYVSSWANAATGGVAGGGSVGRSTSQSIESSSSSRDIADDAMVRQSSVADGEAIKIVIHDVDTDFGSGKGSKKGTKKEDGKRRVKIIRQMDEITHRGGNLGMRIVGGKVNSDGALMATVVWIIPGGPAYKAGVRQGDKVLEWNGMNLVNRNFEDVCAIIEADESKETIDVLLESSSDVTSGSSETNRDDNPLIQTQRGSLEQRGSIASLQVKTANTQKLVNIIPSKVLHPRVVESIEKQMPLPMKNGELEKSLMSVSRRKLPQIPSNMHRAPVSGKIQVQMWYDKSSSQLIATILSAHDLRHREGYVAPEPFANLRLVPHSDLTTYTTPVTEPSTKPLWNASFLWDNVSNDTLPSMTLEISVLDFISENEKGFLGECLIDLRVACLDERPAWFRLQERRSRSANTTPRGSIVGYEFSMPTVRRPSSVKPGSEEFQDREDSRHSSFDSGFLHPDLALRDPRSISRRGSSVSEHGESEIYQLARSYPHSLPQSRRSSFAYQSNSPEFKAEELEERLSFMSPPSERRRAHSVRVGSQRELLQEAGWRNLNQTPHWLGSSSTAIQQCIPSSNQFSLTPGTRRGRSNSLMGDLRVTKGSPKNQRNEEDLHQSWRTNLGPGQVVPRAYRAILTDDFTLGEIRLELSQTRGHLEVEVSNARGLPEADSGQLPDTYVKTYLKDGDRRVHKRKTRVIKQSKTPNFYQTLRYPVVELNGRTLLVMVWEKTRGFEHNIGLGVAEIAVNKLELRRPVTGWYRLLPVSSVDRVGNSDSD